MKAIAYYQSLPIDHADSLQDIELPAPTPGARDLLVEVRAISVNPVDTKIRRNVQPENGQAKVLGWDVAGVVKAVGSEVSLFQPGDGCSAGALTRPGGNAELHLVDERIVGKRPQGGLRPVRRPAADRHHRLGTAVRPPRDHRGPRRPGPEPAGGRRGRRRGLHPRATGPPAHRPDRDRHRLAPGNPGLGPRAGAHHVIDHSQPLASSSASASTASPTSPA